MKVTIINAIKKAQPGVNLIRLSCLCVLGKINRIIGCIEPIWFIITTFLRKSTPNTKIAVFGSTNGRAYLCEFINKSLETGDQDDKTPKVDSKGAWPAIRMINGMVIKLFINIYQMTAQGVLVMLLGVPNGLNDSYT